jgi:hypothetical protein
MPIGSASVVKRRRDAGHQGQDSHHSLTSINRHHLQIASENCRYEAKLSSRMPSCRLSNSKNHMCFQRYCILNRTQHWTRKPLLQLTDRNKWQFSMLESFLGKGFCVTYQPALIHSSHPQTDLLNPPTILENNTQSSYSSCIPNARQQTSIHVSTTRYSSPDKLPQQNISSLGP